VCALLRNQCAACSGIGVRLTPESLCVLLRILHFIEPTVEVAVCPDCGKPSTDLHDRGEPQMIRDLPIWERRCWLRYSPRRFKCNTCGDTFVERVSWRESGRDYTVRYERHIYKLSKREPISQVAKDEGLSEDIVQGIFEQWAKKRSKPVATHS